MRKILLFHIIPQGRDKASFVGIFHDVTEMYDRRREENEKQKNDMVSLLAAGVAHEIGNPLNVISIHLQLLEKRLAKRKNSAKEDLSLLDVTKKEIARLDNIIKRFFQALRIDKPSFARTNIKTLLIESLNFMKPEVENKRIKINCELPDAIPALRVDEDQIKQAFFNIIKNAIEAMPEGGELDIVCDLGEDFVKISFHDSGQGIEPELMNKIFNPYFTTKKTGSGLGLVVVERIVRENNGKLRLDSSPEHGTTFIIELPLFDKQIKLLAGAETKKNESNPKT
jgi:signal transduction histidine kinase